MKRIVFGLLFSVVASVAAGQCWLEPAEDIAQSSPSACKTYYDNVFALLFGGFSEKPEARYASLPSFTEEYAFSLEKDKKGYRIVSTTLTANYRVCNAAEERKGPGQQKTHFGKHGRLPARTVPAFDPTDRKNPPLTKRAGDRTERPTFSQARTTRGKRPSAKHGRPNPPRRSADSSASATIRMLSATGRPADDTTGQRRNCSDESAR